METVRHSRLMADIIISKIYRLPLFSWGEGDLTRQGGVRYAYLEAVRAADNGSVEQLLKFARS